MEKNLALLPARGGHKTTTDIKAAAGMHRAGRLAEAEAGYREVLAAEPSNARAMHLLGIVLGQLGRVDESLESLELASRLLPESAELFGNGCD